ncbi:MAG TPA: M1 family aminopeptidase, partial [Iamia sp.]|nr:M1 family aminopeptidase [Iamia sp.]
RADGKQLVHFNETMPMSTYLVAMVVGPLEATEPVQVPLLGSDSTIPLRIAHVPGKEHLTPFAAESASFGLQFFADYYGIVYPGDKCDLIAVPDFAFGAMENLGCITFREVLLLVDPKRATHPELKNVADVIHHELAHMWFGDLVTMKWWNGIWLNEAFATFMEMKCTDAFRPAWDRWTAFGLARTGAFDTDSLASTRPIEFEVVSPADAEGMFDVLTYEKGAAVVRMLEQFLGEDRFRDGIRLYISRHAHGNTVTTDLWDAIEEATGEPVRRIMDSWIFQGGHPEVAVTVEPAGEGATLRLAQQRFLYDSGEGPEADATEWAVPVLVRWAPEGSATASSAQLERVLVEGPAAEIALSSPPAWVLANSGGSGFFRVRYDAAGLAAAARAPGITALERYGLVDDAWASLMAGSIGVVEVLDLLRRYADETDLSVWQRVLGVIAALDRVIGDDIRPDLQAWVRAFAGPALRRVGLDPVPGESARTAALRAALTTALGTTGADPETRQRAQALLDRADTGDHVDTDLFDAALKVLAAEGGADRFATFRQRSATGATPQERLRYLGVLADFPGDAEADAFLAMCLTDDVRTQDAPFVIRRSIANRSQSARTWDFLARHWDQALARFPTNSISRMLDGIRTVTDPGQAHAIEGFLVEHPVPQGEKPIAQHRERMRAGVALRERVGGDLASALKDGPG